MTIARVEDTLRYHIAAQLLPLQGLFIAMVMPVYFGGLVNAYGFTNEQIANLATADSIGALFGLGALTLFVKSMDRRLIALIALALTIGANLANAFISDYEATLALRAVHGVFGTLIFGLACAYYGNTAQPDRWFAWRATVAVCIQSIAFQAAPPLIEAHGVAVIYWIALAVTPVTLWAIFNLPRRPQPYGYAASSPEASEAHATSAPVARPVLWALFAWLAASAAFGFYYQPLFVFSERLGDRIGLNLAEVGTVLAVSTFLGIIGSAAVSLQGDRLRRAGPIAFGSLGGLAVCLLLYLSPSVPSYWIGLSVFSIVWSYLPCFINGYIAVADRSGRSIIGAQFVNVGGAALATAVLGAIMARTGLNTAVYMAMSGIVATGVLALLGAWMFARARPR